MQNIKIQTARRAIPMIYAYSLPEVPKHYGWLKIGYTEQGVQVRINQQTHTAGLTWDEAWRGNAVFDDGSGDTFRDTDFHSYLRKLNVPRREGTEWFQISSQDSKQKFNDFRSNRGLVESDTATPYTLRKEQAEAVRQTIAYHDTRPEGAEFLWNAKPRFGKTLSVYDFIQKIDAVSVLIVTNRPAIANSWYEDFEKFVGTRTGWRFISETDSLRGKPLVMTRKQFLQEETEADRHFITFLSLQDLKGSKYFGGDYDKLREIAELNWSVLVIDEAHEGVDTYKTDAAFERIHRRFTLHLSGTPFKALANEKFPPDAIFNWTYKDEQTACREWNEADGTNPYAVMPRLNLFTYQMSEIVREEVEQGIEIDGETENFAFDLNEFFKVENGKFKYEREVDRFLDSLTTGVKYPFSTPELRKELRHTFWLLDRVESARQLAKKLKNHPIFKDYEVVLAAGDGQLDDSVETGKAFDRVKKAISENDRTITLSVGQLTTGVTIPEWAGVLMLSNVGSPALYMQAAFRAQNPCLYHIGNEHWRKENAYVFDFDPARTLTIYEEFANGLSPTARNDSETRNQNIRELLNFFPVIGEDESGEMVELDAENVLSIPRRIHCQEVVRRGFMCDFLFQNIQNVFHAPAAVLEILEKFTPCKEAAKTDIKKTLGNAGPELESPPTDEQVIGLAAGIFGENIYDPAVVEEGLKETLTDADLNGKSTPKKVRETLMENVVKPLVETAKDAYKAKNEEITKADQREIEAKLNRVTEEIVVKALIDAKAGQENPTPETIQEILVAKAVELANTAIIEITKTVETNNREREREDVMASVRDHLRGFTRTIPAFLMAYGDDSVTLATFDQIIPPDVFRDVTSISLDQFRFLRDGGDYEDPETGETKRFEGHLFDEVVFNDSVTEFLTLREKLADYYLEGGNECEQSERSYASDRDIFDYIPPQKTNQIFTPKRIVRQMVDLLEVENPGCFDDPTKTFMDLYMKSGLYIAEIVKRLYRSPKMRKRFPDDEKRLEHIFRHQVFGLAPTEIIYRIATNFLLGFDKAQTRAHNFRLANTLEPAQNGTLEEFLSDLYRNSAN